MEGPVKKGRRNYVYCILTMLLLVCFVRIHLFLYFVDSNVIIMSLQFKQGAIKLERCPGKNCMLKSEKEKCGKREENDLIN